METQQGQNGQLANNEVDNGGGKGGSGGGGGSSGGGSYLCRQSSTRWTPTSDQIRILKELYYNNGVRSPGAEQIQRISARLRQYGKIEGKNVFYWFQNHKARERQKKRFTTTPTSPAAGGGNHTTPSDLPMNMILPGTMQKSHIHANTNNVSSTTVWKYHHDNQDRHHHHHPLQLASGFYNKYPNITCAGISTASTASAGMHAVGQMGTYGHGAIAMEKSFMACTVSGGGSSSSCLNNNNFGWVNGHAVDPYSCSLPYTTFFDKQRTSYDYDDDQEDGDGDDDDREGDDDYHGGATEIETLPLFPLHGDLSPFNCNLKPYSDEGYYSGRYGSEETRTSLELSLNSYTGRAPGSI